MTFTRVDLPEFCNPTSVSSISCDQKRLRSQSTKPDHQDIEGYAMGATEVGGHAAAPACTSRERLGKLPHSTQTLVPVRPRFCTRTLSRNTW